MEELIKEWENSEWIFKVNTSFTLLFFVLILGFILALFWIRLYKNQRNKRKKTYEGRAEEFINTYLFDDAVERKTIIENFKKNNLRSQLQKKVFLKELLGFNENFKGESSLALKQLFHELNLDEYLIKVLKRGNWYQQSRAIYLLAELSINKNNLVATFLNAKREEVREQAIFYYLKVSTGEPLQFFSRLTTELTPWELIYVEDSLKYYYEGSMPDFSKWLDHRLESIVVFSIKMIAQFDQFENIPKVVPFIDHPNPIIKKQAIKTLCKLSCNEILEKLIHNFPRENVAVKKEILNTIKQLGSPIDLISLQPFIPVDDWSTRLAFNRIEQHFSKLV
ncbi:hypothetical protein HX109_03550 [Galbibacter sp. BG1]|uniref:HEAT repeat domain-containing protein n=1 Tax=Galbibacter sp. BG1 TaxID=1170699 RepID=UPI0015BB24EC|nr:HEAT repeat domain-containing protein [Galbibacter sp. BG1]QLE00680.1 hypothetical protein HX109_03550 [Galbibacter sp. BG1]